MKKVAIYPGSFNPWHEGHSDVLNKALEIFDEVVVAIGLNPEKNNASAMFDHVENAISNAFQPKIAGKDIRVVSYTGLLVDEINDFNVNYPDKIMAVVKGLRNGKDLEYEQTQQYWNEKLGITIPTVYFVATGDLVYVSSSALRAIERFK